MFEPSKWDCTSFKGIFLTWEYQTICEGSYSYRRSKNWITARFSSPASAFQYVFTWGERCVFISYRSAYCSLNEQMLLWSWLPIDSVSLIPLIVQHKQNEKSCSDQMPDLCVICRWNIKTWLLVWKTLHTGIVSKSKLSLKNFTNTNTNTNNYINVRSKADK